MKSKKILLTICLVAIIVVVATAGIAVNNSNKTNKVNTNNINQVGSVNQVANAKYKVTVSNFASYDFLRAIIGDNKDVELNFLLGPGKDAHSYDPTPKDLIQMQESDLFVYVGGEMESWHERVIGTLDATATKLICIADDVETIEEKEVDGAEEHDHDHEHEEGEEHDEHDHDEDHDEATEHEHEHEEGAFDEHIWTSPKNAIVMINTLEKAMEEIAPENASIYKKNAENYIAKINKVDNEIKEIVNNKKRNRLVFGDKMPMQYFIDYYGLEVSAAFVGCSTETEPSSKTIAYLVNKAKEENIPVILYIELNNGKVADTIAKEVGNGCEALQIQTLHNLSKDDFDNGETWVSLMERNLDVLKKALQ